MPNFDSPLLLIIPLLSGYLFLISFYFTRYYHSKIETQRLIFNSIICAFLVYYLAYFADIKILQKNLEFRNNLKAFNPFNYSGLGFSIFTLFVGVFLAHILNLLIPTNLMLKITIKLWGDEFERLFYKSMREKEIENGLLMITMDNGKVYIGYVNKISKPLVNQQIEIIPYISGYREEETKILHLPIFYFDILEYYIDGKKKKKIDDEIGIILPKDRIISASRFSIEVFNRFNVQEEPKKSKKKKK